MGKAKKGKKAGLDDEGDDEVETESAPIEDNAGRSKNKAKGKSNKIQPEENEEEGGEKTQGKKQKKDKKGEDVDDMTKGVDELALDASKKKGAKKTKGKKSKAAESGSENEDEVEEDKPSKKKSGGKASKKMGFSILAAESGEDESEKEERAESEDEEVVSKKKKKKPKQKPKAAFDLLDVEDAGVVSGGEDLSDQEGNDKSEKNDLESEQRTSKEGKGGKKSKKKKRKNDDDEDELDKVLAELALEYSGKKRADSETLVEKPEVQDDKQQEQKVEVKEKVKEKVKADKEEEKEVDEEGHTVKTAAQKKKEKKEKEKEKKEKEKQKKLAQKKQESTKKAAEESTESKVEEKEGAKVVVDKPKKQESTEADKEPSAEPEPEAKEEEDDDGKKKKKKKGAKEDDKKDKKGPSKKAIAAMQEALQKLRDEEDKLKREEEERIRKLEEAEKLREEKLRQEQERKDKKKLKDKERKERLKAEGKLLTAKQKVERARAQALIDHLKAQGVEIGEKKPARPGTRLRSGKGKQQQQQQQDDQEEAQQVEVEIVDKSEAQTDSASPEGIKDSEQIVVEEVKDSWDAESSAEEEDEDKSSDVKSDEKVEGKSEPENDDEEEDDEVESESEESGSDDDDESESESESEDEEHKTDAEKKRERAMARIQKRHEEAEVKKSLDNLRAAVVCVLGHVDTGKTKILDKLRRTNVQDGEAGGITQQIGATNVPIEAIRENTKMVKGFSDIELKLPGLLIIDTPGHESFSNLRSRGSSLCDIAILVVDIMHGLEPQTIESINLLKSRRTPFIVALNKIDRLYDWQTFPRKDIRDVLKGQAANTQLEFEKRTKEVVTQFAEQGLNAALSYENPDQRSYVSLVPTSAFTGEGMGNLLALIVESCQTMLAKRLMYSEELQATVLEVKAIPGLGTTIDVILVNGALRETDTVVLAGTDGPIVTQIRSLLMPQPMKELRVKNAYTEFKEVQAAQGVKIAAKDLEKAIAGLNMLVAHQPDEVDLCREEVSKELKKALSNIKLQERGVYVQASTLGSLEALLEFLRTSKIPYANIRIGPVVKRDVMKASTMLEHDSQYATILAFDVKIERDAQDLADSLGVKIFQADIIYHLFDKFMAYREELRQKKREEFKHIAVFPCKLKILPQFIFNSRDPIVMGVIVEAGIVKEGTPICVPSKEFLDIGVVTSIEISHKQHPTARKGQEVCIKIEPIPGESPKMFGRHFDETDILMSKISRQSIDACKDYFRDDLLKSDWQLMVELKKLFQIL